MKNWDLTPEAFYKLLTWLDADREHAGEKYEKIRQRLIIFFQRRRVAPAEDQLADETITRVARKIDKGEDILVSNPSVYFLGVADNVIKEYWRKGDQQTTSLDDLPPAVQPSRDPRESEHEHELLEQEERRNECMEQCLERLSSGTRDLIVGYGEVERDERKEARKKLAEELGISAGALRSRVTRIRAHLRVCVNRCLKRLSAA
jgi:RNA polymerase sigma factor (sigma-70 family)